MATFVLVHGAWDGGWTWRSIARALQAAGYEVFTPTLTGSGERVHLASPTIDLNTHILDIVHVLRYEQLDNVILVGYNYGGMVITGVAEQVSQCLSQLVYLDAFVPQHGQTVADLCGPENIALLRQLARASGDDWLIPHNQTEGDRRTGFFIKACEQPLRVTHPAAARLKHTYIHCTGKPEESIIKPIIERIAARVQNEGWHYHELPFDDFPLLDHAQEIARLLLDLV